MDQKNFLVQFIMLQYLCLFAMLVHAHYRPHESYALSRLTIFNELCYMAVLYCMYSFTDVVLDSDTKQVMASTVIGITCLNVLVQYVVAIWQTILGLKLYMRSLHARRGRARAPKCQAIDESIDLKKIQKIPVPVSDIEMVVIPNNRIGLDSEDDQDRKRNVPVNDIIVEQNVEDSISEEDKNSPYDIDHLADVEANHRPESGRVRPTSSIIPAATPDQFDVADKNFLADTKEAVQPKSITSYAQAFNDLESLCLDGADDNQHARTISDPYVQAVQTRDPKAETQKIGLV